MSVTFLMFFHGRPEITRMSIFHMRRVIDYFERKGVEASGIAVGNNPHQVGFASTMGLKVINTPNDPLHMKFREGFSEANKEGKDYVCWLGSNNVHSFEYFDECIAQMKANDPLIHYFGSKSFTIASDIVQLTKKFTARKFHLCSSGQFYRTASLTNCIAFKPILTNFDGALNTRMTEKFTKRCYKVIRWDELDNCIDLKTGEDMHSYGKYKNDFTPLTLDMISDKFPEVEMYLNGSFNDDAFPSPDKSPEPQDAPLQ